MASASLKNCIIILSSIVLVSCQSGGHESLGNHTENNDCERFLEEANYLSYEKKFEQSLAYLDSAENCDHNLIAVSERRGIIYFEMMKYTSALNEFQFYLSKQKGNSSERLRGLAWVAQSYAKFNQFSAAKTYMDSSLLIGKDTFHYHAQVAIIYSDNRMFEEAIAHCDTAYAIDSTVLGVLYNRGTYKLAIGDTVGACSDFGIFARADSATVAEKLRMCKDYGNVH